MFFRVIAMAVIGQRVANGKFFYIALRNQDFGPNLYG
jgi:hypothetical protein